MRVIRQLLRWSLAGWTLTLLMTFMYAGLGRSRFEDGLMGAAIFASACLLGAGAMSLGGGGMVWQDVHTRAARRQERERWDEEGAVLTPLGASLLVVPQLVGGAIVLTGAVG